MNMVFGRFDFTPDTGGLRRDGRPVKLQSQPARVLALLLSHAGTVVSRETLQREIWGSDTHVDFERGLNYCIAQIRSALGDTAESPRFIETVPRQGYRFIAPLTAAVASGEPEAAGIEDRSPRSAVRAVGAVAFLLVLVFSLLAVTLEPGNRRTTVAVIPFYNETGDPALDRVARAISDATVARLATPDRLQWLEVIGNHKPLLEPFARSDVQAAAREADARWVVIGQLKGDGTRLRVIGHLIRVSDMKHVWADTFDASTFDLSAQASAAEAFAAAITQTVATN